MNELANEKREALQSMDAHSQVCAVKSLDDQRQELCMRLQANRRQIAIKLAGPERNNQFPRSAAMRFMSNPHTHEILHKAANAALGLQTFRVLRWGVSAMKFFRKGFR